MTEPLHSPISPIPPEESARLIVPHLLSAYASGELSFIEATARCARAVDVRDVSMAKRQMLLGAAVEALLSVKQKTNREARRARPLWLCRACSELVDAVSEREGLPLSRPPSAAAKYGRAAAILRTRREIGMT